MVDNKTKSIKTKALLKCKYENRIDERHAKKSKKNVSKISG